MNPQQKRSKARKDEERLNKCKALYRDGFKCVYCGRNSFAAHLVVHHIIYKSQGGTNKLDNLITLCQDSGCNAHNRAHLLIKDKPLYIESSILGFVFSEVKP